MTIAAGARLGGFEVLGPLGAGGMGEVYRARDTRLGREVALKVLPEALSSDRERLARFEQEARAASALNHPNIVTIHEIGREGETTFVAMELVDGKTLRELSAPGPDAGQEGPQRGRAGFGGPGQGPRRGNRPPGPEARKRDGLDRRLRQDPRLRPREADGDRFRRRLGDADDGAARDAPRDGDGHGRLHVAGAGLGRAGRLSLGSVLARAPSSTRCSRERSRSSARRPPRRCRRSSGRSPSPRPACARICRSRSAGSSIAAWPRTATSATPRRAIWPGILRGSATTSRKRRRVERCFSASPARATLAQRRGSRRRSARSPSPDSRAGSRRERSARATSTAPSFKRLSFQRGAIGNARFAPGGEIVYGCACRRRARHPASVWRVRKLRSPRPSSSRETFSRSRSPASSRSGNRNGGRADTGTLAVVPIVGGAPRPLVEDVFWAGADWDPQTGNGPGRRPSDRRRDPSRIPGRKADRRGSLVRRGSRRMAERSRSSGRTGDKVSLQSVIDRHGRQEKTLSSGWVNVEGRTGVERPDGAEIWFTAFEGRRAGGALGGSPIRRGPSS